MTILTSTENQKNLPLYFKQVFKVVSRIDQGGLEFKLPDGRVFRAQGPNPGPIGHCEVLDTDCFARLVRDGDTGFMESYMDGEWTTPDLQAFMDVVFMNFEKVKITFPGKKLVRALERIRHWLNSNTKRQARKNISYHYDLGNDFYGCLLYTSPSPRDA